MQKSIRSPRRAVEFAVVAMLALSPLAVRAVWSKEANSGPVETIEWLYQVEGAASWSRAAMNPASDPDHTYRFDHANTYLLAAKASGPGGTAQTPVHGESIQRCFHREGGSATEQRPE